MPRHLRLGVKERVRADGGIEVPLDEVSLARAVRALAKAKVRSVAVCYLHAWRDDVHGAPHPGRCWPTPCRGPT